MLTQLSIHHLRNLKQVHINLGQCNVFIGDNGSGKTSLLESLHLLSRGKSFRHHQPKHYITHHQPSTTVHAKFADGSSMAIQKSQDASTLMRLSGQSVYVQSALTKHLPTLLIDPSSMDILEVGSGSRRQLLDWIAFHVEQGFHPQWVAYQRLLKQRNAILRQSHTLNAAQKIELAAWDKGLSNHAGLITHYRQQVFDAWKPLFYQLIHQLLPAYAPYIQLRFSAGYNTDIPLDELLNQRLLQDSQMGYTRIGCHRADIQVLWVDKGDVTNTVQDNDDINNNKINNNKDDKIDNKDIHQSNRLREQAANILSRGEKKLLITALRLSQLPLLMKENATLPLVLLDDITAELDDHATTILLETLAQLSCQVFITSLDDSIIDKVKTHWTQVNQFHMKQGDIQAFTIPSP